jgi:hypothetical protein
MRANHLHADGPAPTRYYEWRRALPSPRFGAASALRNRNFRNIDGLELPWVLYGNSAVPEKHATLNYYPKDHYRARRAAEDGRAGQNSW